MDALDLKGLLPFARTETQKQYINAVIEHGNHRAAAAALGVSKTAVTNSLLRTRRRAAKKGYAPKEMAAGLAMPGFAVKRRSTYYDLDTGRPTREWLIQEPEKSERWAVVLDELQGLAEGAKPLPMLPEPDQHLEDDLVAILPYGDPHIGLYAWHEDAEEDFDLTRAVQLFTDATGSLISQTPSCGTALVAFLGDFFHSDDQTNRTRRSGHQLDVDSRWAKVLRVGCRLAATLVWMALQKHGKVHVICEIGNHDDHTAVMLAVYLDALFNDNPRVTIDLSPARVHYFRFGLNLIGIHHGDLIKAPALPGVMATDRPQDWGETKHRAWYTGHIHTQTFFDLPGCQVESFRILPPRDNYAESNGYRSGRSMDAIIRHRTRGEIGRYRVYPDDFPPEQARATGL